MTQVGLCFLETSVPITKRLKKYINTGENYCSLPAFFSKYSVLKWRNYLLYDGLRNKLLEAPINCTKIMQLLIYYGNFTGQFFTHELPQMFNSQRGWNYNPCPLMGGAAQCKYVS